MEERLQKLISSCGLASRRTAEEWISSGRVTVNGEKAHLGDRADLDRDQVLVDGKRLRPGGARTYLMLNKPRGYVSTLSDEQGRKTVADLVSGCGARVWPIGRLDLDSEGLLLLTDNGEITHRLLHPSHEVEKEYLVWVTGNVEKALPILSGPMVLDGEKLAPAQVRRGRTSGGVSQIKVIKKLFDASEQIIVATDAGREGELIFRYLYHYTGCPGRTQCAAAEADSGGGAAPGQDTGPRNMA